MQIDMIKFALISMSDRWTDDERQKYSLLSRDNALSYHQDSTKKNFGLSLSRWAAYYLIFQLNSVGFAVIIGNYTGGSQKWLERMLELSNKFANDTLKDNIKP